MKELARVYVQSLNYSVDAVSGGARRVVTLSGEIADEGEGSLSGLMALRGPLILCVDDEKADRAYRAIAIDTIAMLARANSLIDEVEQALERDDALDAIRYAVKTWRLEQKGELPPVIGRASDE